MDILGFEKLIYHSDKIEKIRKDELVFPVHATISLGNYCNHACLWCSVYAYQQSDALVTDRVKLISFLERAWAKGMKAVGYVGNGEPTAYPKFAEFVKQVHEIGYEQGMFTNGFMLDRYQEEVLKYFTYFRISLDAGSTEVHNEMHDVENHFDKIIDNVRSILRQRKGDTPVVGFQYATHHRNLHDLPNAVRIATEIGVDYISVKPVFTRGSVEGNKAGKLLPKGQERIERNELTYDDLNKMVADLRKQYETPKFAIYHRPFQIQSHENEKNILTVNRCYAGFFNLNIYEDNKAVYCGPHRVAVGSLDDDLDEMEERIRKLSYKLDLSKCPAGCRYHAMNHIVESVLNPEKSARYHPNFL